MDPRYDFLRGRYFLLLASIVVLGVLYPILEWQPWGVVIWTISLWAVLLGGLHAISRQRKWFWVGGALAGMAMAAGVAGVGYHVSEGVRIAWLAQAFTGLNACFLGMTTALVVVDVLGGERVDVDRVFGSACGYLLMGLSFGFAYMLVCDFQPSSLVWSGTGEAPAPYPGGQAQHIYFSFTTLTTLGYGDLTPNTAVTRLLAGAEAVIGMLYLTILVARLVGLHISHGRLTRD